jgi:hypothetical protein
MLLYLPLFILVLVSIALILAFPVLLHPLRAFAKSNFVARISTIILLSLLSFGVVYAITAWLIISVAVAFTVSMTTPGEFQNPSDEYVKSAQDAKRELWIRQMIPTPLRRAPCYTTEYECEQARKFGPADPGYISTGGSAYLRMAGLGLFTALVNMFIVWRFTRPPKPVEPVKTSVRESAGQAIQD